ncbi:MAG: methionyl-tRNA formyltransferase [Patescibacteria group bacterium]
MKKFFRKIAFFGTSDRSVPILESLKGNFDLVLCVTKEDVLIGRHQTPKEVEVKRWARENRVNFVTINESLKDGSQRVIEQIKLSEAEIGVVADFGFIIPQEILDIFPKGLINIHFSLLPKYRGASPVQFAILNGDAQTGITYQLMEKTLDTGPVIEQVVYKLNETETSGELYKILFNVAANHLPKVLKNYLDGKTTPKVQDESQASYTRSPSHPTATHIFKEDARINWGDKVQKIDAAIRAYSPWPVAWTTLEEMQNAKDKVAGFTQIKDPRNATKTVKICSIGGGMMMTKGRLAINEIQIEGGKVLSWQQFCNGYLALH